MNVVLWALQLVLALLYFSGGAYKAFAFEEVARQYTALPHGGWRMLGALEMLGAILLVVPAALRWMPGVTPFAAALLAVESLALSVLFARYSVEMTATNPLVWVAPMGVAALVVAVGRSVFGPTA